MVGTTSSEEENPDSKKVWNWRFKRTTWARKKGENRKIRLARGKSRGGHIPTGEGDERGEGARQTEIPARGNFKAKLNSLRRHLRKTGVGNMDKWGKLLRFGASEGGRG